MNPTITKRTTCRSFIFSCQTAEGISMPKYKLTISWIKTSHTIYGGNMYPWNNFLNLGESSRKTSIPKTIHENTCKKQGLAETHTNCGVLSADLFEDIRAYCFLDKRAVVSVAIDHVASHPYVRSDNIELRTHLTWKSRWLVKKNRNIFW